MQTARKHLTRIILTALLILGILGSFWNFIRGNTARIRSQNEEYIHELTAQRAISVENLITENLSFIRSTAFLYGQSLSSPMADIGMIRDYEENTTFDMLRFIDAVGDNYTSAGRAANLSDRAYFQAGMRGESGITFVAQSRVTGERQIGFYAPVRYQGDIIGVMVGFFGEAYIRRLLEYSLFGSEGEGWLCDADGMVLGSTALTEADNYFTYLGTDGGCSEEEIAAVRENFRTGADLSFRYLEDGNEAVGYAVGLDGTDWVLIRSFPPDASARMLGNANREGIRLIMELIVLFLVYGAFLIAEFFVEHRRMKAANQDANDISRGVSALFASFLTVDLAAGSYRYLEGEPPIEELPSEGEYRQFCSVLEDRIRDPKQRKEVLSFIGLPNLRQMLSENPVVSTRVHADVGEAECYTFNFITIEKDNGVPRRVLVACQDVTQLYHKEQEEQQKLQDALEAAEKASRAKTEFLFNMSHDLRTPMNAIIGYTELARQEGVSHEEILEYIRKIDTSSGHLLALINDILEMSRIESGKLMLEPEDTDLEEIIREVRDMFQTQMEQKDISFTAVTKDLRHRYVSCDKNRLNRVLLNLLSNACKFTPAGGTVEAVLTELPDEPSLTAEPTVTAETDTKAANSPGGTALLNSDAKPAQKKDADRARIVLAGSGETAAYRLTVRDTGIGMSEEFLFRLFNPFERERTSTVSGIQGTGLGLSITKKIVGLMGGTIEVHSRQGEGTTFVVDLRFETGAAPQLQEAPESTETKAADPDTLDYSRLRLLLAEDNMINREIASMFLTQSGFMLETAENGQIALDMVKASEPGYYDAILMDIQMPVMDGYEATRQVRALADPALSAVPIIAMTANAFKEDIDTALAAGMNGHIAKPLDVNKMMETIDRVLRAKET